MQGGNATLTDWKASLEPGKTPFRRIRYRGKIVTPDLLKITSDSNGASPLAFPRKFLVIRQINVVVELC
jgi:hypothetical protein